MSDEVNKENQEESLENSSEESTTQEDDSSDEKPEHEDAVENDNQEKEEGTEEEKVEEEDSSDEKEPKEKDDFFVNNDDEIEIMDSDMTEDKENINNQALEHNHNGVEYGKKGNYQEALDEFSKVIELKPNDPKGYCNRANIKFMMKEYQDAIADYKRAIDFNFRYFRAFLGMAQCQAELGDYENAIDTYTKTIALEPKDQSLYCARAKLYMEMKLIAKAQKDIDTAINIEGTNYEVFEIKGILSYGRKDFKGAMGEFNKAILLNSTAEKSYLFRAKIYKAIGNNDKAIANIAKAYDVSKNVDYLYLKAKWLKQIGKYNEAYTTFLSILQKDDNYPKVYQELADIDYSKKRYEEARKFLEKAAESDENLGEDFYCISGNVKMALASFMEAKASEKLVTEALGDYNKAKNINPNSSQAFIGISNASSKLSTIRGY